MREQSFSAVPPLAPGWLSVCRGAALGMGILLLLNTLDRRVFNVQAGHCWFCPLAGMGPQVVLALLAMSGTAFLLFAVRPSAPPPVRWCTLALLSVLMVFTALGLFQAVTSNGAGNGQEVLFLPLFVLTSLTIVAVGLISPKRMLPASRPPIFTIVFVAGVTFIGFVVSAVRGGIGSQPTDQLPGPLCVVVVADARDWSERRAMAFALAKKDPETALTVVSVGAQLAPDASAEVQQSAAEAGVSDSQLRILPLADDFAAALGALQQGQPGDRPPADAEAEVFAADPEELVWIGDPLHFARVQLLAGRAGVSVVCVAPAQDVVRAVSPALIAVESISFAAELFRGVIR